MKNNPLRRTMYVWVAVTAIAAAGVVAPLFFGPGSFEAGYALIFLSLLLAITGIVAVFTYHGRARVLDGILSGQNVLAHWTYSPEEWRTYIEKARHLARAGQWSLFRLLAAIAIAAGLIFWLFNRGNGALAFFFVISLLCVLAITVPMTTVPGRWLKRQGGEVYLAREGALVNGRPHLWHGWGASMDCVRYMDSDGMLEISYSTPGRSVRKEHKLIVAVPAGQEQTARKVMSGLAGECTA